jgi:hypothetical protein
MYVDDYFNRSTQFFSCVNLFNQAFKNEMRQTKKRRRRKLSGLLISKITTQIQITLLIAQNSIY